MRHLAEKECIPFQLTIESCGLGDWHTGKLPDPRMREAALKRGVALVSRAKCVQKSYLEEFDLILAADHKVLNELHRYALTPEHKAKLLLITHFSGFYPNEEIPDPYYSGDAGFEHVLDMIEDSCTGLLNHLKKRKQV